jgi:hypothetical protein
LNPPLESALFLCSAHLDLPFSPERAILSFENLTSLKTDRPRMDRSLKIVF